jgi:hypothetical protein
MLTSFRFNFHRHGDREWIVRAGKKVITTKEVCCLGPTTTKVERQKAYIIGTGVILVWSEEVVVIQ